MCSWEETFHEGQLRAKVSDENRCSSVTYWATDVSWGHVHIKGMLLGNEAGGTCLSICHPAFCRHTNVVFRNLQCPITSAINGSWLIPFIASPALSEWCPHEVLGLGGGGTWGSQAAREHTGQIPEVIHIGTFTGQINNSGVTVVFRIHPPAPHYTYPHLTPLHILGWSCPLINWGSRIHPPAPPKPISYLGLELPFRKQGNWELFRQSFNSVKCKCIY